MCLYNYLHKTALCNRDVVYWEIQCYSLCTYWYIKLYFVYRGVVYWEIQCYSLCTYWYIKLYFVYRGIVYWEIQCYSLCTYWYINLPVYMITLSCDIALSHDIPLFCHMYLYSSNRSHPQNVLCTKISSHYLISREISFTLMEVPANYNGLSCYFYSTTLFVIWC